MSYYAFNGFGDDASDYADQLARDAKARNCASQGMIYNQARDECQEYKDAVSPPPVPQVTPKPPPYKPPPPPPVKKPPTLAAVSEGPSPWMLLGLGVGAVVLVKALA